MGGAAAPSVNLRPPHISETIRDRNLKFYTRINRPSALLGYEFFPLGASQGQLP